ncbi:hypothetical protein J7E88_17360 [Streptomyces sp. ISL-10]|uniref:hypothetical protein n=1 Tax=Streptomyces sp. ISL-10 TaxID=2819172 RepID=UPI001BE71A13|nr:hypothetical protein [Streptomyces sp. ISL-10]MBT2367030.1 hypothetical protein [Streptomyces sp. ISL-10]
MRAGSIAFRSAGVAAVLILAPATAAAADDSAKAVLAPSTAAPGDDVGISATGCMASIATARSDAFLADAELTARRGSRGLTGEASVRSDVLPGTYDVRVRCDGREHSRSGHLEVVREPNQLRLTGPALEPPLAPVRAGGGGTVAIAAPVAAVDPADAGPSTTQTVVGLVLAGAAAVAVAVRSARRRRAGSD